MSRIPSLPFRTVVTHRPAVGNQQKIEQSNHTNLSEAFSRRDAALKRGTTKKVEVVVVIDESIPGE
jgi:hypothetical protein